MLTQKQILNFFTLAENGSFYRAAKQLYISSSSLIQQINLLEDEIGFRLFDRGVRGVTLTPAGTLFLSESKRVFRELQLAIDRGKMLAASSATRLRIGYFDDVDARIAFDIQEKNGLSGLGISMELIFASREDYPELLRNDRIDCVITPVGEAVRKNMLSYQVVESLPVYLGFPAGNSKLSGLNIIRFEDLDGQMIVLPKRQLSDTADAMRDRLLESCADVTVIENNERRNSEMICVQNNACMLSTVSGDAVSRLVFRPVATEITVDYAIATDSQHRHLADTVCRLVNRSGNG